MTQLISFSNPTTRCSPQKFGILVLDMAVHAGIGAAAAATFWTLNPMVGAAYGAAYFAGSHSVNYLMQGLENKFADCIGNQTAAKAMKFALAFFSGIALATAAWTLMGVPIIYLFSSGLILTGAMLATTMAVAALVFNHASAREVIVPNVIQSLSPRMQRV
jgi:hypothetical protein